MKRVFSIIILALVGVASVSCHKVTLDSRFLLTVTWKERKADTVAKPMTTAKVYAFFLDPAQWEVTSIDDARNGIVTSVSNPAEKRSYDIIGEPTTPDGNEFEFHFETKPVMLVVADTAYPMYATGNANIVDNLPNLYVKVEFNPQSVGENDKDPIVKGLWKYYGYKSVNIPINTKFAITPSVWLSGNSSTTILESSGAYAFYNIQKKDSIKINSWADAVAGIATMYKKDDNSQVNYSIAARWENNKLAMDITAPRILVVVYNQPADPENEDKIYAYTFLDLSDNPAELNKVVLLYNYKDTPKDTTVYDNTWTIITERANTAQPEGVVNKKIRNR